MYRTKTCGELRISDAGQVVTLAGWVQRARKMGGMTFVDVRDRYGLTQVVFNNVTDAPSVMPPIISDVSSWCRSPAKWLSVQAKIPTSPPAT